VADVWPLLGAGLIELPEGTTAAVVVAGDDCVTCGTANVGFDGKVCCWVGDCT